jgi:hypothetical protein
MEGYGEGPKNINVITRENVIEVRYIGVSLYTARIFETTSICFTTIDTEKT